MAHRKNVKRIDPRYFLNETVHRELQLILEEQGPERALSRWAEMFPEAAQALEATGVALSTILSALSGEEFYNPEIGVDTRGTNQRRDTPRDEF